MNNFISNRTLHKGETADIRPTNTYLEVERELDEEDSFYYYIIPRSESSCFLAVCLDDTFDEIVDRLDDSQVAETVAKTWPAFATLLYNGMKDKYREGALIKLEDLDDGDQKWFVATVVGNISYDDLESIFTDRMVNSIDLITDKTTVLLKELMENKPNMLIHNLKTFGQGFLEGLAMWLGS